MIPAIFKNPIKITGIAFTAIGTIGLIYYYNLYRLESIPSGDVGAYPDEGYRFTSKNHPEMNRQMTLSEQAMKKDTLKTGYASAMRDCGIILAGGIAMLVFGGNKQ